MLCGKAVDTVPLLRTFLTNVQACNCLVVKSTGRHVTLLPLASSCRQRSPALLDPAPLLGLAMLHCCRCAPVCASLPPEARATPRKWGTRGSSTGRFWTRPCSTTWNGRQIGATQRPSSRNLFLVGSAGQHRKQRPVPRDGTCRLPERPLVEDRDSRGRHNWECQLEA